MKNIKKASIGVTIITLATLFSPLILENIFLNNIALYIEQRVFCFTSIESLSNVINQILALLGILLIIYSVLINKNK
ncbi:hypothetical protein FHH43_15845 [Clostridium perfringens]|nr:hypothetical protein [Clostridium perfringens]